MRPISLKLKGFKGIQAGMGLEEIEIDFSKIPSGIVTFSAPNGTGKTTIMDNLHPYRFMPFRASSYSPKAFSFYEHCYGEALKELVFGMNGTTYKSLLLLNIEKKKQEAYLYIEENGTWTPLNDGKLESYDLAVENLLGNPELFFMSVFRAQNAKSITSYSKGDIKEIFTELLGVDHLKAISDRAGVIRTEVQHLLDVIRGEKALMTLVLEKEASIITGLADMERSIEITKEEMARLDKLMSGGQEKLTNLNVQFASQKMLLSQEKEIESEVSKRKERLKAFLSGQESRKRGLEAKISRTKTRITDSEMLISKLPELQEAKRSKAVLEGKANLLKGEYKEIDAEYISINNRVTTLNKAEGLMKEKEKVLQKLRMEREAAIKMFEKNLEIARNEEQKLKNTPCGGSLAEGCIFVMSAVSETKKIPELQERLGSLNNVSPGEVEISGEIDSLKVMLANREALNKTLQELLQKKRDVQANIESLEKNLNDLNKSLESLPKVELAEKELPPLRQELESLNNELNGINETTKLQTASDEAEIKSLEEKLSEITNGLDGSLVNKKVVLIDELEQIKRKRASLNGGFEEATKKTGSLNAEVQRVEEAKGKIEALSTRENHLAEEISQWSLLEKAFGNDGIIALEIDDAGPQITTYANDLLKIFGGRFSVKIETQLAKAKGGMKEGFDITVFDSQTNESKSIKRLSGGEKTWVEEAITRAICLYRANLSGIRYECIFSDEKDGALDTEKKKEFFDMKKRVLELGGYKNEFCITQTDALLSRADAVIELKRELGINTIIQ
ncbi:MAG: AAA family ATPase [Proteobacteria bacterium]|nr:AAA family ATPase [Pseudomonadota bacterium]